MYSALYYPFTAPESPSFLKTALFLWDTVDFIVPFKEFRPHGRNRSEDAALELIAKPYVPTKSDQRAAHEELEVVCSSDLPESLRFELDDPSRSYKIYPQKLLPETWNLLSGSKLARVVSSPDGVHRSETGAHFAYYMMSILAVCCGQGQRRLVTDQIDPYHSLYTLCRTPRILHLLPCPIGMDDWWL